MFLNFDKSILVFETSVFRVPIEVERLFNEVLRFVILDLVRELSGIAMVDVFMFDMFINLDKFIISLTLLMTKLLSVFEYSAPDAIASIVQELFVLLIEMFVPAKRVILSCLLLYKSETDVFKVPISVDKLPKQVLRFII